LYSAARVIMEPQSSTPRDNRIVAVFMLLLVLFAGLYYWLS
jgi:hypothetical protein